MRLLRFFISRDKEHAAVNTRELIYFILSPDPVSQVFSCHSESFWTLTGLIGLAPKQTSIGGVDFDSEFEGAVHHGGKARWQEQETPGHMAPTIGQQRDEHCAQFPFSFVFCLGPQPVECGCPL